MLTDADADIRELQTLTDTQHAAERAMCEDMDLEGDVLDALDAIDDFRDRVGSDRFADAHNGIN